MIDVNGNPIVGGNIIANSRPEITISNIDTDYFISENEGCNTFKIIGSVEDADNDDVTVTASVYGITKEFVVIGGVGEFELELNPKL